MNRPAPLALTVAVADVLATYAYVFAVQAFMPPSGARAPAAYWLTQAWVYLLIAPVAAVATWQGLRQVAAYRAGDRRWWRLSLTGAAWGAGAAAVLAVLTGARPEDALAALVQLAGIAGGLGLLLACINRLLLALVVRPAAARA